MARKTKNAPVAASKPIPETCGRCGDVHAPVRECQRHNGWKNYETWCVHLWITNEESSAEYWREQAEETAQVFSTRTDGGSRYSDATVALSSILKAELHPRESDTAPTVEGIGGLYFDMLAAAFDECEWRDIAESLLRDATEEN